MSIQLSCECGKTLKVKDEYAGRKVKCPTCGHIHRVPKLAAEGSEAASSLRECAECGGMFSQSDVFDANGAIICKHCYNAEAKTSPVMKAILIAGATMGVAAIAITLLLISSPEKEVTQDTSTAAKTRVVGKAEAQDDGDTAKSLVSVEHTTLSADALFAELSPAVVRVVARDSQFKEIGQGSGFFVSDDGLLVTNLHVVKGAEVAEVLLHNNARYFVDGFVAVNNDTDLALLKVNGEDTPYVEIAQSDIPPIGSKVYAIGNPHGYTNTLSGGLISGIRDYYQGGIQGHSDHCCHQSRIERRGIGC